MARVNCILSSCDEPFSASIAGGGGFEHPPDPLWCLDHPGARSLATKDIARMVPVIAILCIYAFVALLAAFLLGSVGVINALAL